MKRLAQQIEEGERKEAQIGKCYKHASRPVKQNNIISMTFLNIILNSISFLKL
jgi:ribonucleotide reductase beta subunit family protein with ferritin-like domain